MFRVVAMQPIVHIMENKFWKFFCRDIADAGKLQISTSAREKILKKGEVDGMRRLQLNLISYECSQLP
ncbi:hypothetical protein Y032_0005g2359 [Ancylostoma ceylanicum]|uniref:Uncharacterized protein n=1 Tax=Ancylostoma ceylanicum TaxID=53326 RepID=A0A016VSE4_9BILA|nr:hypothetical protein Y032_0005g2359 [Ancylostoma ceylanicum]